MSLTYTTLQAALLSKSVHPELTTEAADFVRECEGMIRREVLAQETRTTLVEANRISEGLYSLPATIQQVRAVYGVNGTETFPMENVGLQGIRQLPASADAQHYAVSGNTIEFRGVPGTDAEFEIVGLGWPDALDVTPTNDLLTYHESLYVQGGLFFLYQHTQDFELAQAALSVFQRTVKTLNELISRKISGSSVLPAYNFGHVRTGRGY